MEGRQNEAISITIHGRPSPWADYPTSRPLTSAGSHVHEAREVTIAMSVIWLAAHILCCWLFVIKEYRVSGRLREVLKQKLSALHASSTVRICQLLCMAPLKHFRCKSLQIIRNTDDWWIPISRGISRTVPWVCSLSCWLKNKSLTVSTFSSVQALRGLLLTGRLSSVPVSRNFFNSLLTPRFVQLFFRKFVCQPLCCVPLEMQPFYRQHCYGGFKLMVSGCCQIFSGP